MISENLNERLEDAAELLALFGNGKRLAIIGHLLDGEMSVGAIAERVQLSQSALSQHLAKLRRQRLVETRRDRQMIYYSCRSEQARQMLVALERIFADGDSNLTSPLPAPTGAQQRANGRSS